MAPAFVAILLICLTLACTVVGVESRGKSTPSVSKDLSLEVNGTSGGYRLLVARTPWLRSSTTFFTVNGKRYSTADGGGLKLVKVDFTEGSDQLGPWNATVVLYNPIAVPGVDLRVAFKQYRYFPDIVLFGQDFQDEILGTSNGNRDSVCTGFPSFVVETKRRRNEENRLKFRSRAENEDSKIESDRNEFEKRRNKFRMRRERVRLGTNNRRTAESGREQPKLGFLAYGGIMFGDTAKTIGRWNSEEVKRIKSGLDSGPLVLFSAAGGDALVLSPFSEFMSVSAVYSDSDGQISATWGLMGTIAKIPADFRFWTIACFSADGINKAIARWGEVLRMYYRRGTEYRDSDLTNNYIGFWTDNGAYYYYTTEPGLNYEDTLLSENRYALTNGIPYRYIQYDSWFYYKGTDGGVTEWTAMPSVFPNGMQYVWNTTGLTVVAHNRWWSDRTVYAKEHGGKYNFVVEPLKSKALPIDQKFWDDLMQESRKWGLIVYEQDWLNVQFDEMNATVSDVSLGHLWLLQMGKGARKNGLTIQYCMSPSRHALQSLEIPVVSQARVSDDYQPGNDQWKIGISSMFAHALGVAPFKDNFWTTTNQPGNKYNRSEPYPELESVVSTLSTGPVAPSDRIKYSNKELIMRSCNADGLILKPSKPAMSLDFQIKHTAFHGLTCEVWSTFSLISGWFFGIILAADCKLMEEMHITPVDAGFAPHFPESVVFSWFEPNQSFAFDESSPLTLTGCSKKPFCLYMTSPVVHIGNKKVVLYGELSKWVPMSPNRITEIHYTKNNVVLKLQGASWEQVIFTYSINEVMSHVHCTLSNDGTGTLSIISGKCLS